MKFGLFYELEVYKDSGKNEAQVFHEALDECELADKLGFSHIWDVEHHFMVEYSHSPAPEVFLAAVTQRTKKIRIGTGVVLLPFHHPVNVAERVAVLDILSKGRLDFGTGRGFQVVEYDTYGFSMEQSRARWEESVDMIRKAWTSHEFTYDGKFWKVPRKIVVQPKPIQKPYPPFWVAAVTPSTFEIAARKDVGCLAGPFKPMPLVVEDLKLYRHTLKQEKKPPGSERFSMLIGLHVGKNNEQAQQVAKKGMLRYFQLLLKFTAPILAKTPEAYKFYKSLPAELAGKFSADELESAGMLIGGDPKHVIEKLEALRQFGFDEIMYFVPVGVLPQHDVMESIQLIGDEIIPHFADKPGVGRY
ncbi:MAG: LLM class flavin-dependent oxidoreductase [Euryarchaeota archaeon]|nr:LLM class flavin-dependent oxidoreductase [Euryarchaeota archaeon]